MRAAHRAAGMGGRVMSKSADAFRTIAEVADELDVAKHVLRFWENKFPHIRPMKRGGGRRYYRPEDMELLRGVRHLLHAEGYTIKGVQKILREQGVDGVKSYGRIATAEKPRSRKVNDAPDAANVARPAAVSKSRRPIAEPAEIISKAIAELEACRLLLGAPPRNVGEPRNARRSRSP